MALRPLRTEATSASIPFSMRGPMPQRCPSQVRQRRQRHDKRRKKPRTEAADHPRVLPEPKPTRRRQRHEWQWCESILLFSWSNPLIFIITLPARRWRASRAMRREKFLLRSSVEETSFQRHVILTDWPLTPHYRQSTPRKITMISGIAARRAWHYRRSLSWHKSQNDRLSGRYGDT